MLDHFVLGVFRERERASERERESERDEGKRTTSQVPTPLSMQCRPRETKTENHSRILQVVLRSFDQRY